MKVLDNLKAAHGSVAVRENLSQGVARQIEEFILSSDLGAGSKLPGERHLSRSFGISRTVLREAIHILESKGIVETSAARGVFVTDGGFEKTTDALSEHLFREAVPLREFIEARRLLETHVASLAARNRTDADLDALTRSCDAMEAMIDDIDRFFQEDIDFHMRMTHASGNRLYPVWLKPIMANLMLLSPHKLDLAVRKSIVVGHRDILAAVQASDTEAAAAALRRHIDQYEADAYAYSHRERGSPPLHGQDGSEWSNPLSLASRT